MKRFLMATLAGLVLLNLSLSYAQHGKGAGSGGPGVSHKPMTQGKPASATSHTTHTKLTPSEMLAGKPKLTNTLKGLLPANTDMATVCDGFRNLGQCVAAVHVSHNLGMSFTDLKTKMLGTPASGTTPAVEPMSLGQAIQAIDPKADATAAVKKANRQAKADVKG